MMKGICVGLPVPISFVHNLSTVLVRKPNHYIKKLQVGIIKRTIIILLPLSLALALRQILFPLDPFFAHQLFLHQYSSLQPNVAN